MSCTPAGRLSFAIGLFSPQLDEITDRPLMVSAALSACHLLIWKVYAPPLAMYSKPVKRAAQLFPVAMPWIDGLFSDVRGMFTFGTWTVACGLCFERSATRQSKLALKNSISTLPLLRCTAAVASAVAIASAVGVAEAFAQDSGGAAAAKPSPENTAAVASAVGVPEAFAEGSAGPAAARAISAQSSQAVHTEPRALFAIALEEQALFE